MLDFLIPSANSYEAAAKLEALGKSHAIIEFNMDGTIITANANFLGVTGYRIEEIQGKHHGIFVDPEYRDSAEYRQFWESLNRGEYQAAQYKRIGKGGKEIWIEASYNPILDKNGKPYKVVKFATDVTKQKTEYADLLGKVNAISRSQAVIEFNMDGTIITANENFLSVMGYTLAEVKGKHHSIFVEPAYKESAEYKKFWESLNRGEYQAAQYKRLGKGGKEIWIEASYNPIFDMNGKVCKVVKFAMDLTKRKTDNMKLAASVKGLVKTVTQSTSSMQSTAESLAATAEETSQKSQAVAAASEELTSSVAEISRQLSEAAMVVNTAVSEAKNSETMVSTLINAAQKIGSVSDVVAQIAEQTNLLALNATIEAARAGEAGKGFSVVASEVKSLANQTAKATDEISQQVKGIQDSSQLTGQGIQQIVKTISKVSEISTSISGAVEEQSAATREVSQNITIVKQAAAQTGQSSASVLEVTQELAKRAAELEKQIDEFIAGM